MRRGIVNQYGQKGKKEKDEDVKHPQEPPRIFQMLYSAVQTPSCLWCARINGACRDELLGKEKEIKRDLVW
jgi:hypothetical protein